MNFTNFNVLRRVKKTANYRVTTHLNCSSNKPERKSRAISILRNILNESDERWKSLKYPYADGLLKPHNIIRIYWRNYEYDIEE
jgi:hypothetical protein